MSDKILIVDDESAICELLKLDLELEGYVCETAADGYRAMEAYKNFSPDIILLDLMMPGMNGYEVCGTLRKTSSVPVIMLTAKAEIDDKLEGLECGADDYVTKPFDTRELIARIKSLLRRSQRSPAGDFRTYANKDLVLTPASQTAKLAGQPLHLTVTEYEILLLLLQNKNKVYSREEFAEQLGLKKFQFDTRSLDMHIQRIRRKIAALSSDTYIETVFGVGYKMQAAD